MQPPAANPFGYVDHSAFSGAGVALAWGEQADGQVLHIRDARRGLACECICPACGARLVAKKGSKIAHYFAHYGGGSGCGCGPETNAHFWAKQVLIERMAIWTPPAVATARGLRHTVSPARWMTFDDVRSERRLGSIVPDIVLILPDSRELIVEIRVTHPCGDEKIALLNEKGWAAIEVDLQSLRTCEDARIIEQALLEVAPRTWLCNPKRDRAVKGLQDKLAANEAARLEKERRRLAAEQKKRDDEVRSVARKGIALIEAATAIIQLPRAPLDPEIADFIARDEGDYVGFNTGGDGFLVSRNAWQARIAMRFACVEDVRTFALESFELDNVREYLEAVIDPRFRVPPGEAVRSWIREKLPTFRFPDEAIADYLDLLCMGGILEDTGIAGYTLASDRVVAIERRERHLREIDRREETALGLVDQILADLPPSEILDFDAEHWCDAWLPGRRTTPTEIIAEGTKDYTDLVATLRTIASIASGSEGTIVNRLGLPIDEACERARARTRQRLAREEAQRLTQTRDAAKATLGSEAAAWFECPLDQHNATPLALAGSGEAGLLFVLDLLSEERSRREAARLHEEEVARRRAALREQIKRAFPPDHRELVLTAYARDLDCSPWAACDTEDGFVAAQRVLVQLAPKGSRRRPFA